MQHQTNGISTIIGCGWRARRLRRLIWLVALIALPVSNTYCQTQPIQETQLENRGHWVWDEASAVESTSGAPRFFRLIFPLAEKAERAIITVSCDNRYRLFINDRLVGSGDQWQDRDRYEVTSLMQKENVICIEATNDADSPGGLVAEVLIADQTGKRQDFSTGSFGGWKVSQIASADWTGLAFDDAQWKAPVDLGGLTQTAPWKGQVDDNQVRQKTILAAKRAIQERFALLPSDRLTLIGSGFIERLQYDGSLEAALYRELSGAEFQIRNLGWNGDDVWGTARAVFGQPRDGFNRLQDDLIRTEPTVVLVGYGANESFSGPAGLAAFSQQLDIGCRMVQSLGATVVLVTPPPFETLGKPLPNMESANQNLQKYCDAIRIYSEKRQVPLIDLHQKINDSEALPVRRTENGVQLSDAGRKQASKFLAEGMLGHPLVSIDVSPDATDLILKKNELYFHRYRPQNETYLFLFRKHEQGNNAVEIPVFDTLVRQTEREIRQRFQQR